MHVPTYAILPLFCWQLIVRECVILSFIRQLEIFLNVPIPLV